MKRIYTLAIAVLFIASGCTFFTEIDADVDTGANDEDSSSCDALFVMLEAESDEGARAELAAAYARCIDGTEPDDNNSDPRPCDEGSDECDPRPCDDGSDECGTLPCDGEITEDGRCVPNPRPCDEDDADCHPGNPDPPADRCRLVEENADAIADMTDEELQNVCAQFGLNMFDCIELIRQCLADSDAPVLCEETYDTMEQLGVDPNGISSAEAYTLCAQHGASFGFGERECRRLSQACFPVDQGDDGTAPTCQDAYDILESYGVDPKSLSINEAHDLCVQYGSQLGFGQLTERQCSSLAQSCFSDDDDSDDSDTPSYCGTIIELVEDQGYTVPLDPQTADHLYHQCVQNLGDAQRCDSFRQCVI